MREHPLFKEISKKTRRLHHPVRPRDLEVAEGRPGPRVLQLGPAGVGLGELLRACPASPPRRPRARARSACASPDRTRPGPSSSTAVQPAPRRVRTQSTQRTGLAICAISAAVDRLAVAHELARAVRRQRHLGVLPGSRRHLLVQPGLDGLHQLAVEGGAHLEAERLRGAGLGRQLEQPLHAGLLAGRDDLARRVEVRGRHRGRPRTPARRAPRPSSASSPMIAAIAPGRSDWISCHQPAALGHHPHAVLGSERARGTPRPCTRRGCGRPRSRGRRPGSRATSATASEIANSAGWATSVRVSSSIGPSRHSFRTVRPGCLRRRVDVAVEHLGVALRAGRRPCRRFCEPWPGKRKASLPIVVVEPTSSARGRYRRLPATTR